MLNSLAARALARVSEVIITANHHRIGDTVAYLEKTGAVNPALLELMRSTLLEQHSLFQFINALIQYPSVEALRLKTLLGNLSVNQQSQFTPLTSNSSDSRTNTRKIWSVPAGDAGQDLQSNFPVISNFFNGEPSAHTISPAISSNAKLEPDAATGAGDTNIHVDYGASWSLRKTARDVVQNFFDGHGGRLDGTTFTINENDRTMRIQGQGEFSHKLITTIGGTTKKNSPTSAGQFGEGSLIATLILLRDHGASRVSFSSRNWRLDFRINQETGLLHQTLSRVPDQKGNLVEIETQNPEVYTALREAFSYFRFSGHPHFEGPTYENSHGGFKLLARGSKGALYPLCQRRPYIKEPEGPWIPDIEELVLWTNQRPNHQTEASNNRDRVAFSISDAKDEMTKPLVRSMTDEDLVVNIGRLRDYWSMNKTSRYTTHPNDNGLKLSPVSFLEELCEEAKRRKMQITLGPHYYAAPGFFELGDHPATTERLKNLYAQPDVIPVQPFFNKLGVPTIIDLLKEKLGPQGLKPSQEEIIKINIMKAAAAIIHKANSSTQVFQGRSPIEAEDLEKPIFICSLTTREIDPTSVAEYHGDHIWFDRERLASMSFSQAISAYLHEILHRHGGDTTAAHGYALTDALVLATEATLRNPELRLLEQAWSHQHPSSMYPVSISR